VLAPETDAPLLQTWAAPQLVPSLWLDHAAVEAAGVQTWQAFDGFGAPGE
jgi:hypothetical protein